VRHDLRFWGGLFVVLGFGAAIINPKGVMQLEASNRTGQVVQVLMSLITVA
jgi:hypothetical protein